MSDPWTSKVCELCGSIFASTENLKRLVSHSNELVNPDRLLIPREFNEVVKSRESGCKFCKEIWEAIHDLKELVEFQSEHPTANWHFNLSFSSSTIPEYIIKKQLWLDIVYIIISIETVGTDEKARIGYFDFYAPPDDPSSAFIGAIPPVFEVGSSQSFRAAKGWLQDCVANHEKCPSSTSSPLPTRVLEVCPDSGLDKLRLYESKGEKDRYAALSYCWGGPQPIVTSLASLETHQKALIFELLPRTIQDAIITTRELGIRYLWIDALCIIQDSLEDKGRELNKMAGIYKNAHLTISASSAASCMDGFLQTRTPNPIPERFIFPFRCPDDTMGNVILEKQQNVYGPGPPISKRGWTFQERLLSPRLLMYGDQGLSLECQTGEQRNGGWPARWVAMYDWQPENPIFAKTDNLNESEVERFRCAWGHMVSEYAARSLTFSEDRLTAISGVAEEFRRVFQGDEYLAGMWKSWLVTGLLWSVGNSNVRPRPKQYLAPSWSWASVDGPISSSFTSQYFGMGRAGSEKDIVLVSCKVDPAPLNRVRGGELVLRGKLRPAIWDVEKATLRKPNGAIAISNGTSRDAIESEGYPVDVFCLHLRHTQGMILQMIEEGTYQRKGYWACQYSELSWFEDCELEMLKII